jgi:hypothetical protein
MRYLYQSFVFVSGGPLSSSRSKNPFLYHGKYTPLCNGFDADGFFRFCGYCFAVVCVFVFDLFCFFVKKFSGVSPPFRIACTQPRRVAAITVAARVASERSSGARTGSGAAHPREVAHCVRFDDTSDPLATRLLYLTDGMLLRETLSDRLLSRYATVILDEAHERTVQTDVLFALLKGVQRERAAGTARARNASPRLPPLRIVVMSATLDADKFAAYFDGAPILRIPGRQHPVAIMHTAVPEPDYVEAAGVACLQIAEEMASKGAVSRCGYIMVLKKKCSFRIGMFDIAKSFSFYFVDDKPPVCFSYPFRMFFVHTTHSFNITGDKGDILVFLPGQDDIQSVQRYIEDRSVMAAAGEIEDVYAADMRPEREEGGAGDAAAREQRECRQIVGF